MKRAEEIARTAAPMSRSRNDAVLYQCPKNMGAYSFKTVLNYFKK